MHLSISPLLSIYHTLQSSKLSISTVFTIHQIPLFTTILGYLGFSPFIGFIYAGVELSPLPSYVYIAWYRGDAKQRLGS
ncbi:hypothetical protein BKA82DRAFT_2564754 [Pisolithus tinctorius]|nr:hypothetical protein BKA82DRAFT_2564754 [Pisolithus tinctorius]